MPFIIWGSRGITSTKDSGEFFCPHCDAREEYRLRQVRPFFTVYFIPIFPIGGATRYVECLGCGKTYTEEVLNYEPPSEGERFLGRIYDELRTGTSLSVLLQKMVNAGVERNRAEELLDQMCKGKPNHCGCGQSFHPDVHRCTHCGETL